MPINPEKMKLYPGGSIRSPEWRAIVAAIRESAGNRCEGSPTYPDCNVPNGGVTPWSGKRVVCTTAHLDHDEANVSPNNLRFWCQRCHNAYDHPHRAANRRSSRGAGS